MLHEFRLDDARDAAAGWKVHLLPGDASAHLFDLNGSIQAPSAPGAPDEITATVSEQSVERDPGTARSHLPSYLLWGVGTAGAVTATVFFLDARRLQQDANRDFERDGPNGVVDSDPHCTRTTAGDAKAANWRTAALLTGIGAGASLIAGTTLYFWGEKSTDTAGDIDGTRASWRAWVDFGGVGIGGIF